MGNKYLFEINKDVILKLPLSKLLELQKQCEEVLKYPDSIIYDVAINMKKLVENLLKEINNED